MINKAMKKNEPGKKDFTIRNRKPFCNSPGFSPGQAPENIRKKTG